MIRSRVFHKSLRLVVLAALVLALLPAALHAAQAQNLTKVTVRVNGFPYGSHVGFFVAKRQGYYAKFGLDVEVLSGSGSSNVSQLVANKNDDFGYASSAAIINQVALDAPIISVATIDATDADAVICHPDAGVNEPKDLEGKTILTAAGAAVNILFPAFLKAAGVDESKIKLTNVAAEAVVPSFLQKVGGAECLLGGVDDKPSQIKAEGGFDPVSIKYNEYIPPSVGYGLITHRDNLTERPEVVRGFVEATLMGYQYALENPEKALDDFMFYNGAQLREQMQPQMEFTLSILLSRNNTEGRLGWHVEEDWQTTLDIQKNFNDLETDKAATDFYTNDFVPEEVKLPM